MSKLTPLTSRMTNLRACKAALKHRGSLQICFDPKTIWLAELGRKRGRHAFGEHPNGASVGPVLSPSACLIVGWLRAAPIKGRRLQVHPDLGGEPVPIDQNTPVGQIPKTARRPGATSSCSVLVGLGACRPIQHALTRLKALFQRRYFQERCKGWSPSEVRHSAALRLNPWDICTQQSRAARPGSIRHRAPRPS